jgi:exodeoxyribonuclease VII large subunit
VVEMGDFIGWLRQKLQGEHAVRACVLGVEPAGGDSVLLVLGEADPIGTADPPRIKARLNPAERSAIAAERGGSFDPASLVNRTVEIQLRTSLRQRFGRGAGVQAKVVGLIAVGDVPIDIVLQREAVLQRLRSDGVPFGPKTWQEPDDPYHVALIVSEHGDARRDVETPLQALEVAGFLRIHRIWAVFEGPSAERSLVAAMTQAEALHAEHGLSATLICRGGGPVSAFGPLNSWAVADKARRIPNLVCGLGHAATPRTALDEVASLSVATPTAAAVLIRDLAYRTAVRASRALAGFDDAVQDDIEKAGRIALARATAGFEEAVRLCLTEAEIRLGIVGQEIERSLLSAIAGLAAAKTDGGAHAHDDEASPDLSASDVVPEEGGVALVIDAGTGLVMTNATQARQASHLMLQFLDGVVTVQVAPQPLTAH